MYNHMIKKGLQNYSIIDHTIIYYSDVDICIIYYMCNYHLFYILLYIEYEKVEENFDV